VPRTFEPWGMAPATPAIDVKSRHAKIGEPTLENDFLEGALTKAAVAERKAMMWIDGHAVIHLEGVASQTTCFDRLTRAGLA
jgi:hypothetical protein